MRLHRGDTFVHPTKLDLNWVPEPGQTWAKDAPHAEMIVTRTRGDQVWYGYNDGSHSPGVFVTTQDALANLMEAYK